MISSINNEVVKISLSSIDNEIIMKINDKTIVKKYKNKNIAINHIKAIIKVLEYGDQEMFIIKDDNIIRMFLFEKNKILFDYEKYEFDKENLTKILNSYRHFLETLY